MKHKTDEQIQNDEGAGAKTKQTTLSVMCRVGFGRVSGASLNAKEGKEDTEKTKTRKKEK